MSVWPILVCFSVNMFRMFRSDLAWSGLVRSSPFDVSCWATYTDRPDRMRSDCTRPDWNVQTAENFVDCSRLKNWQSTPTRFSVPSGPVRSSLFGVCCALLVFVTTGHRLGLSKFVGCFQRYRGKFLKIAWAVDIFTFYMPFLNPFE